MGNLARRIDSNVVQFERAKRELPSAELSVTLPIMLVGLSPDSKTSVIDVSESKLSSITEIAGRGNSDNRRRVVNGIIDDVSISKIGPDSPIGQKIEGPPSEVARE